MEIVNGYPCFTCNDVSLAKREIDPARPWDDPRNPNAAQLKILHPQVPLRDPAVTFGGDLVALNSAQSLSPDSNTNAFGSLKATGSIVDVSA